MKQLELFPELGVEHMPVPDARECLTQLEGSLSPYQRQRYKWYLDLLWSDVYANYS